MSLSTGWLKIFNKNFKFQNLHLKNVKKLYKHYKLKTSNSEICAHHSSALLSRVHLPILPTSVESNQKSMLSMGSQYLINQSLHTQPGSQDVGLSVHSTDWHSTPRTHTNNLWGRYSTSSAS